MSAVDTLTVANLVCLKTGEAHNGGVLFRVPAQTGAHNKKIHPNCGRNPFRTAEDAMR